MFFPGSSPRAWGKVRKGVAYEYPDRIIPTGVGKRKTRGELHVNGPDHPHGRGEKEITVSSATWNTGSSPRAWGKGGTTARRPRAGRIIPTGVGKSDDIPTEFNMGPDHPHGRGEKRLLVEDLFLIRGSSPRAWGKGDRLGILFFEQRIIPTGVGKRDGRRAAARAVRDHPHGRGEKQLNVEGVVFRIGSSPRAWGKAEAVVKIGSAARIIPTGVGKSGALVPVFCRESDHPHGRGEKILLPSVSSFLVGSSPRAWGKALLTAALLRY